MKYTELKFYISSGEFFTDETNSLNSYTKNRLYDYSYMKFMYVDTDKLEIGRKKFKKDLLKYYNNIIKNIEQI